MRPHEQQTTPSMPATALPQAQTSPTDWSSGRVETVSVAVCTLTRPPGLSQCRRQRVLQARPDRPTAWLRGRYRNLPPVRLR